MVAKLEDLEQRRGGLAEEIAREREQLTGVPQAPPELPPDLARDALHMLGRNIGWIAPLAAFVVIQPRRSLRWLLTGWTLYRLAERASQARNVEEVLDLMAERLRV